MRIAHLTAVHRADDVRIAQKEARSLAGAGYDLVVIAPGAPATPVAGVRHREVPVPRNRAHRFLRTSRDVLRAAIAEDAEVYHLHDPELLPVGLVLRARGKKVIYDVHEDLPAQVLTKFWIPSLLRRPVALLAVVLDWIAKVTATRLVAATPAIARKFPAGKTVLVQNFPRPEELWSGEGAGPYGARPPLVAYVGGLTAIRGTRQMIEAIGLVSPKWEVRLAIAGEFAPEELKRESQQLAGWERVVDLGWQSRAQVRDLLGSARLGLLIFQDAPNHREAQPNKLFEYMSAGLPVVASNFPLWREIILGTGCGLVVDPAEPGAVAAAVAALLADPGTAARMGERGRAAVTSIYNWDREFTRLATVYAELLATG